MNIYEHRGFTLIELIITVALFSLILSLSVPNLNTLIARQDVHQTSDIIARSLHLARSEAIMRGNRVVFCLSNSSTTCNATAPDRFLVFSDPDHTGTPTSTDDLIQVAPVETPRLRLSYNRPYLAFSARGHASGTNGTFTVCNADGYGAMLVVSVLGRTRKAVDYDNDGLVEKTPGNPIQCPT